MMEKHRGYLIGAAMAAAIAFAGTAGAAQDPGGPLSGFAHDSNQPIEITADSLEVAQADRTAIFRGNVDAAQGTIRLKADMLKVYYRTSGDSRPQQPSPDKAGAIRRLDAEGNVLVSSPSESAEGEWAVYDVDNRAITMGDNVTLTRGQNVIRGSQLVIDLDTGQSQIRSPASGGAGSNRVRGLFVPDRGGESGGAGGTP